MLKKILCLVMCFALCFAVGCLGDKEGTSIFSDKGAQKVEKPKPKFSVNPLTGLENLEIGKENDRPVAITINNISVAQKVQTGINNADIVYETEVEGGITRLVAVYQDVTKTEKIGTVRSARYPFIDLAMGHNAIYVHHGQDDYHAGPHLRDVDRLVVSENNAGARISNGLSREHTLYAYGQRLWDSIKSAGIKTQNSNVKDWVKFANEKKPVSFESVANSVSVQFSNSYKTTFNYDATTGRYSRYFRDEQRMDYVTGEAVTFKNVFVLNTTIRSYPGCTDGKGHKQVLLESGSGYYCSNGTYTKINWRKGSSSNGFVFTKADGTELEVNPGNSWVCIANLSATPIFG